MSNDSKKPADLLDGGLAAMRNDSPSTEQIENASSRVLHKLQAEFVKIVPHPAAIEAAGIDRIRSCVDFRALIPAYLSSSLTASRKLLFEDHIHECVVCRKALEAQRGQGAVGPVREAQARAERERDSAKPQGTRAA